MVHSSVYVFRSIVQATYIVSLPACNCSAGIPSIHPYSTGSLSTFRARDYFRLTICIPSTESAVYIMHNDLVRAIDRGHVTALVLFDLSVAFDTVDHELLIEGLKKRFAIGGVALNWFKSYLNEWTQTFMFGDAQSMMYAVNSSVPQGSVLGPLEFVAYVVEIMHQYQLRHHIDADDMQLYAHSTFKDVHICCCSFKTVS